MAKLFIEDEEYEIQDGDKILDTIEEAGVPIGCSNGTCATCVIEVEEGLENLSPINESEEEMGMEGSSRLGCQCSIKSGTVKITY